MTETSQLERLRAKVADAQKRWQDLFERGGGSVANTRALSCAWFVELINEQIGETKEAA